MVTEFQGIRIPQFDLTGKVAIVTGGTKGLGLAISPCRALLMGLLQYVFPDSAPSALLPRRPCRT